MLYNLLFPFSDRIPLFNVMRYPTFRMLMAGLVSLVIGLLLGPSYIEALRKLQHGTSAVREDTPEAHQKKTGTPSMGGGLILWAMLLGTRLAIPFVKVKAFNPALPWFIYLPLAFFVIVGTSNAVNLTDGLDGLAIGPVIVSALTFMLLAYLAGATIRGLNIADYLLIPHIPGAAELAVFCAAMAGAGISFLWFNTYPASVLMGDVGSLALGGGLGALAVLTKHDGDSAVI